jgi:hypothetical protein
LDEPSIELQNTYYIEYMNHVLAAAKFLQLEALAKWSVPSHLTSHSLFGKYADFASDVAHVVMQIRLANGRRKRAFSVELTTDEKDQIRTYAAHIKEVIEGGSFPAAKRDELLRKLNRFLAAVDQRRTDLEAFTELALSLAATAEEFAKRVDPATKLIDKIMRMIGLRKAAEGEASLPAPQERPRIEPPAREQPKSPIDDDIPF